MTDCETPDKPCSVESMIARLIRENKAGFAEITGKIEHISSIQASQTDRIQELAQQTRRAQESADEAKRQVDSNEHRMHQFEAATMRQSALVDSALATHGKALGDQGNRQIEHGEELKTQSGILMGLRDSDLLRAERERLALQDAKDREKAIDKRWENLKWLVMAAIAMLGLILAWLQVHAK